MDVEASNWARRAVLITPLDSNEGMMQWTKTMDLEPVAQMSSIVCYSML